MALVAGKYPLHLVEGLAGGRGSEKGREALALLKTNFLQCAVSEHVPKAEGFLPCR